MNRFASELAFEKRSPSSDAPVSLGAMILRRHRVSVDSESQFSTSCRVSIVLQGSVTVQLHNGCSISVSKGEAISYLLCFPHRVIGASHDNFLIDIDVPLHKLPYIHVGENVVQQLFQGLPIVSVFGERPIEFFVENWVVDGSCGDFQRRVLASEELTLFLRRIFLESGEREAKNLVFSVTRREVKHVSMMIRFLSENYAEKIRVGDVAAACGLSQSSTMRIFKSAVGVSILEFLTLIRVSQACSFLRSAEFSIIEVAFNSGFFSLTNFYEVFAKRVGMTPQVYRDLSWTSQCARKS